MRVSVRGWCHAVLMVGASVAALQGASAQETNREDVNARARYMLEQRAYPNATISPTMLQTIFRLRADQGAPAAAGALRSLLPSGAQWTFLGPFGIYATDGYYMSAPQSDAGRVSGVAFDPADPNTFYVAAASGGVWKSTNSGATWTPMTDDACSLDMGAIAVDPVNSAIVYGATGEYNQYSMGCGMLRTTAAGASWQAFGENGWLPSPSIAHLYIDPTTAGSATSTIVLAASLWGILRSTDSGMSWSLAVKGSATTIAPNPQNPQVLFAGNVDYWNSSDRGVMRSADKGATWSMLPLPPGVTTADIQRMELATSAADPTKVWVAIVTPATKRLLGLYRWDDVAQQWTTLAAAGLYTGASRGDFGKQGSYDLLLAVDPTNANRIYLGGVRLFRSTDGGANFEQIAGNIHVDWHAFQIDAHDPQRILGGSDGGVFLSLDGGDSWLSRNTGLAITQYYPGISVHPTVPGVVMGGSQDNGTQASNGTPLWQGNLGGDGGYTAINYANPMIRWQESQWNKGPHIVRSDLGAFSSRSVNSGVDTSDRAAFIPPLVMSPISPTTLYFGTQRLYRTTDEQTWVARSALSDLTKGSGVIFAIAPAPSDSNTIYVGTGDGWIRASTDGGVTFAASGSGLPNRSVTDIAVDPANPTHAVATLSGSGAPHVWQTTDGGATWASISGTGTPGVTALPDVAANAIVMVPGTQALVVGTDAGIWESGDGGTTWQRGPSGLPNVRVTDLVYNAATQQLVAGTYGRGMWVLPLVTPAAVLRGDVDGDGSVTANDALLTQFALVAKPLGNDAHGKPITALPAADADCNGRLDTGDVVAILRAAVGLAYAPSCAGLVKDVKGVRR